MANSTGYQIDLSEDNFQTFVVQNQAVTGTTFVFPELEPDTDYQYRVRAINAAGTSANSNTITVTTLPEAGEDGGGGD